MKKVLLTVSMIVALSILAASTPLMAKAYTCGTDSQGNPIETSINFGNSSFCDAGGASPITAILLWVISFMAIGVGIAVVIGIILGGIKYAMSDGNEAKAKEGRETIVNAVIGLLLFLFMYAAANFLVPGGLFNK